MEWLYISLQWYFYVLIIGLIFFPLTSIIFKNFFFDLGYPFSKTLAIIFISYLSYILGIGKILSFTRENILFIVSLFLIINLIFLKLKKIKISYFNWIIIFFEEILFLASFLFWAFIRSQEPSIQSLEKFMDFGFINSILRAQYFPPKDIWYPPEPINYYYFGHLTGAFLIKLTNIIPSIGYNLILANIFALGINQSFSLVGNIIKTYLPKIKTIYLIIYGILGAFLVNLAGNLHTVYLFTTGYPTNDNVAPIPFWKIISKFNPVSYWYPNATRFIPYTIHEFPSYSYVVADLHGHVFDIPFVLLTIAILFLLFKLKNEIKSKIINLKFKFFSINLNQKQLLTTLFLGFLTAIHYMTNAFDGPIYLLLSFIIFFIIFDLSLNFFLSVILIIFSFFVFSLPFSSHFSPFVSGIGVNCAPEFLTKIGKIGPFLFEAGNCQTSAFWMLFVLWGFFWVNFLMLVFSLSLNKEKILNHQLKILNYILILFSFGTFLIIIPEFFYIKDIYPDHFRANTMFKLGYQAYIMMSLASAFVFFFFKNYKKRLFVIIYLFLFFFLFLYPFFAIPSYYGKLDRTPELDGSLYLNNIYPQDREIINWFNKNVKDQPVILEAQGDSYTDYERISAHTGLPTVAGWWVHEWLWRGNPDFIGKRIPDIINIYESKNIDETKKIIKKYQIKYIIISSLEKQKYPNINEEKFLKIGTLVFRSSNNLGAIYQVD
ncbi:MAG: DUF2298 domain-containing protein [Patescibacteria group bacterium]|nr:DUF2298 domain-containing protein [Patescibacteria group bacterium]